MPSRQEWHKHEAAIRRLYINENKRLEGIGGVMETMSTLHSFSATYVHRSHLIVPLLQLAAFPLSNIFSHAQKVSIRISVQIVESVEEP